jgi:hypothetical protein
MCEGICVWGREMGRPDNERSPTVLAHEVARATRMADIFEDRVTDPPMQGVPCMARLILAVALDMATRGFGDLTDGRPRRLDAVHFQSSFDAEDSPTLTHCPLSFMVQGFGRRPIEYVRRGARVRRPKAWGG